MEGPTRHPGTAPTGPMGTPLLTAGVRAVVVRRFCEHVLADPQLRQRLRVGAGVAAGDVAAVHRLGLGILLLAGTGHGTADEVVDCLRRCAFTGEDFDRLAHYLLTSLLPERPGPDVLLHVGAALTVVRRQAVARPGPDRNAPGTAPVRDSHLRP